MELTPPKPEFGMPRLRTCWFFGAVLLLALSAGGACAAAAGFGLRLRVDPDRIPADGKSSAVVLAEVVDALGRPAPDGTVVHFATTLGQIVSPVQSIGGLAQTGLTASNAAGTALVSAIAGGVRESVQVEFLAEPGSVSPGSRAVELEAEELSYSPERRVFAATWDAHLRHQSVEIRADGIQYDMSAGIVCAQGNVTLRSGERTLQADALRYELVALRGRLVRLSEEPQWLVVEGEKLETRPDKDEGVPLWDPAQTDDTRTWVKARRAIVDAGGKIILDHATFYVDDARVMTLRRHVLEPNQGGAIFGQPLGFSSTSGLRLDLPWYYRASAHRVGSLHVSRNRVFSGSQASLGWALGLREEYLRVGGSDGALALDDVFHPDRGVSWEHRQQLGRQLSMTVDASALSFDDESPRLRSGSVSFVRPLSASRLSLLLSRSDYGVSEHSLSDLGYRFPSRRAGGGALLTPSLHLRHSLLRSEVESVVFDPQTGEPLEIAQRNVGRATSSALDVNVSLPSRDLGRSLQLTAGLTTGYAWNLGGGSHSSLEGRLRLDRRFGPEAHLGLGFTYSSGDSTAASSLFRSDRQLLTLSGNVRVTGISTRFSFSQDLAGERRFGSIHLARPLGLQRDLLGRPLWRLELSHIFSQLDAYRAASTRLALGRTIGHYQASLCYSPQGIGDLGSQPWVTPFGYGYTYSGGRRLWLEFTASAW